MQALQARAIIAQARQDEIYEGPIPEDDDKAIAEAASLVSMAEQAWEINVRGPQVEAILKLAASDFEAPEPPEQAEIPEEEEIPEPDETKPEPEPEPAPEPEPEEPQGHQIPSTTTMSVDKMAEVEPWEGYADERVPSIIEALELGLEADEDPLGLLKHVWAYESAHKDRMRILKRLDEFAEQFKQQGEPEAEAPKVEHERMVEIDAEIPAPAMIEEEAAEVFAPTEPEISEPEADPRSDVTPEPESEKEEIPDTDNEKTYREMLKFVDEKLAAENLHIPQALPEEKSELPFDLTTLTPIELQRLFGEFGNYAYRVNYLMMHQEATARLCKEAADELHRYLLASAEKYDSHDKAKTMTVLEAEIESDENIKFWRKAQRKHEIFATAYKNERDSYGKVVDILSRLETMRQNEYERSRR